MTTVSPAEPQSDQTRAAPAASGDRRRRVTWRSVVFTMLLVPAAVAVPVLAYTGASILRDEDTGQVVGAVTDSTKPGFEALVTPTPTQMVVMLDADGRVGGVQIGALSDPAGGGTVVSIPVATHLEVAFLDTDTKALDELYDIAGVSGLEQRLETVFTAGMNEVVEVRPEQWTNLIEPLGSLVVENPAAFTGVRTDGTLGPEFPAGQVTLTPDQVADFLVLKAQGEVDTVRNDRQIAFWQAWVQAVSEAGSGAVPGEVDQGLGGLVRGLAAGTAAVIPLPVEQVPIPGVAVVDSNVFLPDQPSIDGLATEVIPFPVGVGRLRTRLVDGVGDVEGLKARAAAVLVENGAEITVIGNAQEFGASGSTVVYFRRDDEAAAQAIADAVGATLERGDSTNETVDIVVLIGRDFADADTTGEPDVLSDDGLQGTTPTSIPISDGETPGITPGPPGGDPLG